MQDLRDFSEGKAAQTTQDLKKVNIGRLGDTGLKAILSGRLYKCYEHRKNVYMFDTVNAKNCLHLQEKQVRSFGAGRDSRGLGQELSCGLLLLEVSCTQSRGGRGFFTNMLRAKDGKSIFP